MAPPNLLLSGRIDPDLPFMWGGGRPRTVNANRTRGLGQMFMAGVRTQPIRRQKPGWDTLGVSDLKTACLLGSKEDPFLTHLLVGRSL